MILGRRYRISSSSDPSDKRESAAHRIVSHLHRHKKQPAIQVEDLSKKLIPILGRVKFAAVIHNLFTHEECTSLINRAEAKGFEEALVHGPFGQEVLRKDIRNCKRCILDDTELTNEWFTRVMNALEGSELKDKIADAHWVESNDIGKSTFRVVGLNERVRILRYDPGQYFGVHKDNRFIRGSEFGSREGEESHLTFLLYLNDKMKGGETRIENGGRYHEVVPKVGSVLIFDHDISHEAMRVVSGVKYCCRSDVMYKKSTLDSC